MSAAMILIGGASVVITGISCLTLHYQRKIAQEKLKLDLYDRRYKVYESIMELFANIITHGKPKDNALNTFIVGCRGSSFLFEKDIEEYIETIRLKAIRLDYVMREIDTRRVTPERPKFVEEMSEILKWFVSQCKESTEKFNRYLRFKNLLDIF